MTDKYKHRERDSLLRDLKKLIKHEDDREFMKLLRDLGIKDEDPRFAEAMKLFYEAKKGRL
jgi:hypothetical protein